MDEQMSIQDNFMGWTSPGSAVITGASAGMGAAFARELARQGFDLLLIARRKDRLDALSQELQDNYPIHAEGRVVDLSHIPETYALMTYIQAHHNDLDVLINNAGFGIMGPFVQIEAPRHLDQITVHLSSPILLSHAALPGMMHRKRGVIINTSSTSAIHKSAGGSGLYTVTKTALTVFSELLYPQVKEYGIYVQSLCPGFTYSEFHDVESMRGFQRSDYPDEAWMDAEEVVKLSLAAVKTGDVLFIPGAYNVNLATQQRKAKVDDYLRLKILF